jgi:hypothetical protein
VKGGIWIEKTLAPGTKVMESMVTDALIVGEVCVEVLKVAVSPGLSGAIPPDQFVPEFQLPESGLVSQTASTAKAGVGATERRSER